MADRLTPRDIPFGLNALGLGLPQIGENLRTERSNQLLDLQRADEQRQLQIQREGRAEARDEAQQAFGRAGAALGLNAPDIGALALTARADPARASALLGETAARRSPLFESELQTQQARQNLLAQQTEQARTSVALNQARLGQIDQQLQGASVERRQTLSNQVRDDFSSAMSDTAETLLAYEQTDRLITGGTALEAQIAITKLAKLSDPGSTVRVEEGRMVASGTGLAERIATEYNKMAGDGFSEGARIQFRNAMRDLSEPTALAGQRIIQDYAGLAARWNLNLDDIIAGTGINPELLGKLAVGQEQFNRRNQVEFSDLMAPTNTGVIQRAP